MRAADAPEIPAALTADHYEYSIATAMAEASAIPPEFEPVLGSEIEELYKQEFHALITFEGAIAPEARLKY